MGTLFLIGLVAAFIVGVMIPTIRGKLRARANTRPAPQAPTPPAGANPPPGAAAAAAAAGNTPIDWLAVGWKVGLTLGILVLTAALAFGGYWLAGWSPDTETLKTIVAYVVAAIISAAVLVWLLRRPKPTAGFKLPKAGEVFTFFLVFALALYAMYGVSPEADLFTTAEGRVAIGVYCISMIAGGLVAANLKKGAWFSAVVGLFIFFSLTGARSWMLLNSDGVFAERTHLAAIGEWWHSRSSNGSVSSSTTNTTTTCDGVPATYRYSPALYRVNGNFCQLRGLVKQGCVSWYDVSQNFLAQSCEGLIPSVSSGIYYMKAETEAVVRFNHCKPFAPGNLLDTCS